MTHERRILVAVPTQGRRDLRRLAHSLHHLPRAWDPVLFLNGGLSDDGDVLRIEKESELPVVLLPSTGYSSARNGILDWASQYGRLVFFDDDQIPCAGWAEALLAVHDNLDNPAHVTLGPRIPVGLKKTFMPAEWSRGKETLLQAETYFRGQGYTGNTMIDLEFIRKNNIRFKTRFDIDGGEDAAFFNDLADQGAISRFASGALAIEIVDEDRLTIGGVYRAGKISARRNYLLDPSPGILRSVMRFAGHGLRIPYLLIAAILTVDRAKLADAIHSIGMLRRYLADYVSNDLVKDTGSPRPIGKLDTR